MNGDGYILRLIEQQLCDCQNMLPVPHSMEQIIEEILVREANEPLRSNNPNNEIWMHNISEAEMSISENEDVDLDWILAADEASLEEPTSNNLEDRTIATTSDIDHSLQELGSYAVDAGNEPEIILNSAVRNDCFLSSTRTLNDPEILLNSTVHNDSFLGCTRTRNDPEILLNSVVGNDSFLGSTRTHLNSGLLNDSYEDLLFSPPHEGRSVLRQSFNNLTSQPPDMMLSPIHDMLGLREDDDTFRFDTFSVSPAYPQLPDVQPLPEVQFRQEEEVDEEQDVEDNLAAKGFQHDHSCYTKPPSKIPISCSEHGGLITPSQSDSDGELIDVENFVEETESLMPPAANIFTRGRPRKKIIPINNNKRHKNNNKNNNNNFRPGSSGRIGCTDNCCCCCMKNVKSQSAPQPTPVAVANAPRKRGRPRREDRPYQPPIQQRPVTVSPVPNSTDGDDAMTIDDLLNIGKRSAAVQAKQKIARSVQQLEQSGSKTAPESFSRYSPQQLYHQQPKSVASTSNQSRAGRSTGQKRSASHLQTKRQVKRGENVGLALRGGLDVIDEAERRRKKHNRMEQKRRKKVRRLFKKLESLVSPDGRKMSRLAILKQARAVIISLENED